MDQQLLVFVTVVEKENFSRAAEKLHMTQPAVSQYVQALERRVGARLLERSNKFIRPTKAGEVVLHHALEIIALYSRMQGLVDEMMYKASGSLAIGASYTFGEYVLPRLIAELHAAYPLIKPTVVIGNTRYIADRVANRQLDVGIVEGDVAPDNAYVAPFADDAMVVVVGANHRLAQQSRVAIADLAQEAWVVREVGSGTRSVTEHMFAENGLKPSSVMEFGSTQLIKQAVEEGLGISFLSHWAIRKELALRTLHVVPLKGFPFVRQFSLVTQRTPFQTKAMELFLELLRTRVPQMSEG
ncbi:LysR family transcriptional regulator [Numidum massiliense]|uniref:LysR family transcriptional regulator n=1 Tax=Numidum massiliense TaxID=1522315 RepID=UPI0006D54566|nr:LysR family transcriptional regulator [Numidum massiliense]